MVIKVNPIVSTCKIAVCIIITLVFAFQSIVFAQSTAVADHLNSESFIERNGGLVNTLYRIKKEKKATVAFLGGSITHMTGWKEKVSAYLTATYPDTKFTFTEAAIPSLGSVAHSFRLNTDLLDKGRVDLLFMESAVNDSGTKEETQRRALEGIIRRAYEANPYLNIIVMAFVDGGKIAQINKGNMPLEVRLHQEIAKQYNLPFINLAAEVTQRINNKEFTWENDFKSMHPAPFGHELYFQSIKTLIDKEFAKPVPAQIVATKLPVARDPFNYSKAGYVNISTAEKLNGFTLIKNWEPADGVKARPGFVDVPILEGTTVGASFEFTFIGRTVGIGTVTGPDAGKINYSIDGKEYSTLDIYIKASKTLHLPYYLILGDGLNDGKHLLKVWIDSSKNDESTGTACRIAYFLVNK
jgi:hypothetical protein